MATEPMFICEYNEQSSLEMESRRERKGSSCRSVDSAHLDAPVVTTVGFLRVQIYKADLSQMKRERENMRAPE